MINVGDPVKANIVNNAFMSRKADTDTIGKVGLKHIGSGPIIDDVQKFINDIAGILGTFENDTNSLIYATNNIISNGDSLKTCIEKFDVFTWTLRQDHDALDAREASNHSAQQTQINDHETRITDIEANTFTFNGNKTFQDDVIINGKLTVNDDATFDQAMFNTATAISLGAGSLTVTNTIDAGGDITTATNVNAVQFVGTDVNVTNVVASSISGTLQITAENLDVINDATIGNDLTVNGNLIVNGTQTVLNTINIEAEDKSITLNKNGISGSSGEAGIEIEEASAIVAYNRLTSDRERWQIKAPDRLGIIEFEPDSTATTLLINRALFDSKVEASSLGSLAFKNTVETNDIDDYAVTTTKIDSGAVTDMKLADYSVTTIKLDDNAVTEHKINVSAVDGVTIVGGGGSKLKAIASFSIAPPLNISTAGEHIGTGIYAVRWGNNDLTETANHIYLSDYTFSSGKARVDAILKVQVPLNSGDPIPMQDIYSFGHVDFNTTVFPLGSHGKIIYLGANGSLLLAPPTGTDEAIIEIGVVIDEGRMILNPRFIGVN